MSIQADEILSNQSSSIYSDIPPRQSLYEDILRHDSQDYVDTFGVRIFPQTLIFNGAFQGKKFTSEIRIQNISKTNVTVKIGTPTSFHFRMQPLVIGQVLAPGLSIVREVTYKCNVQDSLSKTQFPIYVNNDVYIYEIQVVLAVPIIYTEPNLLDFGIMNVGQSPIRRTLKIFNDGYKTTTFKIDIAPGDFDMVIHPHRGEIIAKSYILLECSMISAPIGYNCWEFWLKCEPVPIRVGVEITVIQRELKIFHINSTKDLTVLEFPKTFFGTQRYDRFILKNESAIATTFIVILEANKKLHSIDDQKRAAKIWPDYDSFSITPTSGVLNPFEGQLITVIFSPQESFEQTGWIAKAKLRSEYICFLRVMSVQDNDKLSSVPQITGAKIVKSSGTLQFSQMVEPITQAKETVGSFTVQLAEAVDYNDLPFDSKPDEKPETKLEKSKLGFKGGRVDHTSRSMDLGIGDDTVSIMSGSPERLSSLSAELIYSQIGIGLDELDTFDIHEIVANTDPVRLRICAHGFSERSHLQIQPTQITIGKLLNSNPIIRTMTLMNKSTSASLQFMCKKVANLFISPEAGKLKPSEHLDIEIKLVPRNIGVYKHKIEVETKAKTYLPDSLQREEWIRVGTYYVGINYEVASEIVKERKILGLCSKETAMQPKVESDKDLNNPNEKRVIGVNKNKPKVRSIFTGVKPCNSSVGTTHPSVDLRFQKSGSKMYYAIHSQKMKSPCGSLQLERKIFKDQGLTKDGLQSNIEPNMGRTVDENKKHYPRSCSYFPLSPIQLFSIHVMPKRIKFGKLSTDFPTNKTITVTNGNHFKIKFALSSFHKDITFPNTPSLIVGPKSIETIPICFQSKEIARSHRIINYTINDSHSFDLDIFADTVKKHLIVPNKVVLFDRKDTGKHFQPLSLPIVIKNIVNCYTKFQWLVPYDSCYDILPINGTVPPSREIVCHVYLKHAHNLHVNTAVNLVPESGNYENISILSNTVVPDVRVMRNLIDTGILPLNIEKVLYAYVLNPSQVEVLFQVVNPEPIVGVTVYPTEGWLNPRSLLKLIIRIKIGAVVNFKFRVGIRIQNINEVFFRVRGKTVYPQVLMKPSVIKLRRISAHSFDRFEFTVENIGVTDVALTFPLKEENNEFFISKSKDYIISPIQSNDNTDQIILKPQRYIKLFIHFEPIDVASYQFYFPIVLNGIIGPVDLDSFDAETLKVDPMQFLQKNQDMYRDQYGFQIPDESFIPESISSLRLVVLVRDQILNISKKLVSFYFSLVASLQEGLTSFKVYLTNVSNGNVSFLIKTDIIRKSPFSLVVEHDKLSQEKSGIAFNNLEPLEEVMLILKFAAKEPGEFISNLPIILLDTPKGTLYNHIRLYGLCPGPKISTTVRKIYFAPVPLNIVNERVVFIKYEQYSTESELQVEVPNSAVKVAFPKGQRLFNKNEKNRCIKAIISFSNPTTLSIAGPIVFYDTLGNKCQTKIYASTDNCLLTIHEFLIARKECYRLVNDDLQFIEDNMLEPAPSLTLIPNSLSIYSNEITETGVESLEPCIDFPHYPLIESEISEHLDKVVKAIEHTFYERLFRSECYAKIPEGFLAMTIPTSKKYVKSSDPLSEANKYYTLGQCVQRLLGNDVYRKFFINEKLPEEEIERIKYVYKILSQLLKFIAVQGGCVSHISPKYLMIYQDYLTMTKSSPPKNLKQESHKKLQAMATEKFGRHLTRERFMSFSKRIWLDLLMQIFKIIRLFQVTPDTLIRHARLLNFNVETIYAQKSTGTEYRSPDEIPDQSLPTHIPRIQWILDYNKLKKLSLYDADSNMYTLPERILLNWLNVNYSYHFQRPIFWKNLEDCPPHRVIRNFDADLIDALPFIFLTASYCPYVIDECFTDLFGNITAPEMALHNAARLIQAWTFLKIGLTLTPRDITEANPIFMLMITVHLYEALPNLLPCEILKFQTRLTQVAKRELRLTTKGTTFYEFFLAGDKSHSFSFVTEKIEPVVEVYTKHQIMRGDKPPEHKPTVSEFTAKIYYHAKKIDRVSATLIVCGELTAGNYAQTMVFTLVGEPTLLPSQVIHVTGPLYENLECCYDIEIPYNIYNKQIEKPVVSSSQPIIESENDLIEFQIFISTYEPASLDMFRAWPWKSQIERKIPRVIHMKQEALSYDVNSRKLLAQLNVYFSFFLAHPEIFFIFFLNREIGDFIVKVVVTPKGIKEKLMYKCTISPHCCTSVCVCKQQVPYTFEKCSCAIQVKIPKRNEQWWKCFSNAFQQTLLPNEKDFWLSKLETSLGQRLIQWLIYDEDNNLINFRKLTIFKTEERYHVECEDSRVKHPRFLDIKEMDNDGSVELLIAVHQPGRYVIKLTSSDHLENRRLILELSEREEQ